MILARTEPELGEAFRRLRSTQTRVGLVPTGGSFHRGHVALIDRCVASTDICVVAISAKAAQSRPMAARPHGGSDLERDVGIAGDRGVALLLMLEGQRTWSRADDLAQLLTLVRPDVAFFGRKNLRGAVLARRVAEEVDRSIQVDTAPIVREPDGLAVSSRNRLLSDEERGQAVGLVRALEAARRAYRAGERSLEALLGAVRAEVSLYPLLEIEEVDVVRVQDLRSTDPVSPKSAVTAAVRCGNTRLIDNLLLSEAR